MKSAKHQKETLHEIEPSRVHLSGGEVGIVCSVEARTQSS